MFSVPEKEYVLFFSYLPLRHVKNVHNYYLSTISLTQGLEAL